MTPKSFFCLKIVAISFACVFTLSACNRRHESKEGTVIVNDSVNDLRTENVDAQSLKLGTQPGRVLLTGIPQYRLTPVLKLNWDRDARRTFVTGIDFRTEYGEDVVGIDVRHGHIVPGFEAACAYNMVNVSHFDHQTKQARQLFDSLVLVKTIYFPAADQDTLHRLPVHRDCYMISVFDEDTNKDGFVNQNDLRRFYHFALPSLEKTPLIPKDYAVLSSQYDPGNDFLHIVTRQDLNANGKVDGDDPMHIFWIDMKNPKVNGMLF
jgi:hypothetical protein